MPGGDFGTKELAARLLALRWLILIKPDQQIRKALAARFGMSALDHQELRRLEQVRGAAIVHTPADYRFAADAALGGGRPPPPNSAASGRPSTATPGAPASRCTTHRGQVDHGLTA